MIVSNPWVFEGMCRMEQRKRGEFRDVIFSDDVCDKLDPVCAFFVGNWLTGSVSSLDDTIDHSMDHATCDSDSVTSFLPGIEELLRDPSADSHSTTSATDADFRIHGDCTDTSQKRARQPQSAKHVHANTGKRARHRNDPPSSTDSLRRDQRPADKTPVDNVRQLQVVRDEASDAGVGQRGQRSGAALASPRNATSSTRRAASVSDLVWVSSNMVGCIMGRRGSIMQQMCKTSGATIEVRPEKDGRRRRRVEIWGTREQVEKAKKFIKEHITAHISKRTIAREGTGIRSTATNLSPSATSCRQDHHMKAFRDDLLTRMSKIASCTPQVREQLVRTDKSILPVLVRCMNLRDDNKAFESATKVLRLLAQGNQDIQILIAQHEGVLTGLVQHLRAGGNSGHWNVSVAAIAAKTLRHLACENVKVQNIIAHHEGILTGLTSCLDPNHEFDGEWSKGTISGDVLTWHSGNSIRLGRFPRHLVLTNVRTHSQVTATLNETGKLVWSDGDVWRRQVESANVGPAVAPHGFTTKHIDAIRTLGYLVRGDIKSKRLIAKHDNLLPTLAQYMAIGQLYTHGPFVNAVAVLRILCDLLTDANHEIKTLVARCEGVLAGLTRCLMVKNDLTMKEKSVEVIRRLIEGNEEIHSEFVEHEGILTGLGKCLQRTEPMNLPVLGLLDHLIGTDGQTHKFRRQIASNKDILIGLVRLSFNNKCATRILANLAQNSSENQCLILQSEGVLAELVRNMGTGHSEQVNQRATQVLHLLRHGIQLFYRDLHRHLGRLNRTVQLSRSVRYAIQVLYRHQDTGQPGQEDGLPRDNSGSHEPAVLRSEFFYALIRSMNSAHTDTVMRAIEVLNVLLHHDDVLTMLGHILHVEGMLAALLRCLVANDRHTRLSSMKVIQALARQSVGNQNLIIDHESALEKLREFLHSNDVELHSHAVLCIFRIVDKNNKNQLVVVRHEKLLSGVVQCLTSPRDSTRSYAMDVLECIIKRDMSCKLRVAQSHGIFESLISCLSTDTASRAKTILIEFFKTLCDNMFALAGVSLRLCMSQLITLCAEGNRDAAVIAVEILLQFTANPVSTCTLITEGAMLLPKNGWRDAQRTCLLMKLATFVRNVDNTTVLEVTTRTLRYDISPEGMGRRIKFAISLARFLDPYIQTDKVVLLKCGIIPSLLEILNKEVSSSFAQTFETRNHQPSLAFKPQHVVTFCMRPLNYQVKKMLNGNPDEASATYDWAIEAARHLQSWYACTSKLPFHNL